MSANFGSPGDIAGPFHDVVPVTVDTPFPPSTLYVETGGTIIFQTFNGGPRTLEVADFSFLPYAVTEVVGTGTTATGIHRNVAQPG